MGVIHRSVVTLPRFRERSGWGPPRRPPRSVRMVPRRDSEESGDNAAVTGVRAIVPRTRRGPADRRVQLAEYRRRADRGSGRRSHTATGTRGARRSGRDPDRLGGLCPGARRHLVLRLQLRRHALRLPVDRPASRPPDRRPNQVVQLPGRSPDRTVTATIDNAGRGTAEVRLYGGRLKLDLTVVPVGRELLIDDERLTGGRAETSIYAQPVELPAPRLPDDAPPVKHIPPPPQIFTVDVPIYQQVMNLDCETAALQMALATFGRHYTQAQLFALQALDTRPAVVGANNVVLRWGNPYTNFVGLVDGLESNITGYGVYWPVILQIAKTHWVPAAMGGNGLSAQTIYQAHQAGHPDEVLVV